MSAKSQWPTGRHGQRPRRSGAAVGKIWDAAFSVPKAQMLLDGSQINPSGWGRERAETKKATLMMNTSLTLGCHGPLKNDHFFLEAASVPFLGTQAWSPAKTRWCCMQQGKGCENPPTQAAGTAVDRAEFGPWRFFRDGVRLPMSHFALMSPPFCPPPPIPDASRARDSVSCPAIVCDRWVVTLGCPNRHFLLPGSTGRTPPATPAPSR